MRSLYFFFFLIIILKLFYDFYRMGWEEFKRRLFDVESASFLSEKTYNDTPYLLSDCFFDLIHLINLKGFDFLKSFLFIFLLIMLYPLAFIFLILYVLNLLLILGKILYYFFSYSEKIIPMLTFSNKNSLLYNLMLYPNYWAKITIYGIICKGKKKINYDVLDLMVLNRITGFPLWIIKLSFLWSEVISKILRNEVFSRKSKRLWPKIFFGEISENFNNIIRRRISFNHGLSSENRLIISRLNILANQVGIQDFFKTYSNYLKNLGSYKPYVIKVGGVYHQAMRTPNDSFLVFTSKSSIKTYDNVLKKVVNIDSDSFKLGESSQYLTRSWIDINCTPHKEGYLRGFIEKHDLNSVEDLAGFYTRIGLICNFQRIDYFFFQSGGSNWCYRFPNNRKVFGKYLEEFGLRGKITNHQLLFGQNFAHRSLLKASDFDKTASSLLNQMEKKMVDDIKSGDLNPKFINEVMGEVLNCDNKTLLWDLQKVNSPASKLLIAYSKNSKASDRIWDQNELMY